MAIGVSDLAIGVSDLAIGVSLVVHLYSVWYMRGDAHLGVFMSWLSLFTLFMQVLVMYDLGSIYIYIDTRRKRPAHLRRLAQRCTRGLCFGRARRAPSTSAPAANWAS